MPSAGGGHPAVLLACFCSQEGGPTNLHLPPPPGLTYPLQLLLHCCWLIFLPHNRKPLPVPPLSSYQPGLAVPLCGPHSWCSVATLLTQLRALRCHALNSTKAEFSKGMSQSGSSHWACIMLLAQGLAHARSPKHIHVGYGHASLGRNLRWRPGCSSLVQRRSKGRQDK